MRFFWWCVVIALGLSWGCGSDTPTTMNPTGVAGTAAAGTGTPPATSGTGAATAGMSAAGTGATGRAGTSAPMMGASGTGTSAAGTGAAMPAGGTGTTGMMGAMAGMPSTSTAGMSAMAGTGAMTAGMGAPTPAAGSCGPETMVSAADLGNVMMRGPWTPTMKARSGPNGSSTLFYPMELGKDGVVHPVFHWGCGAGSQPSQYADHLNLLASHGFVVIANASGSMPGKASLDWILAENEKMDSMFYKKLDPNRVGTGGHSLGALETFQYASDPRLKLYVLVCGGSGSGSTGAANIHGPSIFLGGEGEGGTTNFRADYMAITKAPSVFVTKTSTDHIACARNNLGPWVAFMRWQFCGEEKWKTEFEANGTYCKSPWLACMSKGFM